MQIHHLQSLSDPRAAHYCDLPRSQRLRAAGRFVVEGRFLLQRMVENGFAIESILTDSARLEVAREFAGEETALLLADKSLLDEIVGFQFHRGLLACGRRPLTGTLEAWLPKASGGSTIVICDRIVDQENLGGVIRNASGLGGRVVVGPGCADPYSRRVLRVSMGAALRTQPHLCEDVSVACQYLRKNGYRILAAVLGDDAVELADCPLFDRVAIVLGNEGSGLGAQWRELCDQRVTISMSQGVDSLNVASASAILLHHFRPREES